MPRRAAGLLGVVTAAAVLVGCQSPTQPAATEFILPTISATGHTGSSPDRVVGSSDAVPDGMVPAPEGTGYQRYFTQQLRWRGCQEEALAEANLQCATFLAPLDWADPDGPWAVTISMARSVHRSGSGLVLFVNPGGPGASAREFVTRFPATGLEGFDIVGVDPRGSGASTPVVCGDAAATDAYFAVDASPDTPAEQDALVAAQRQFNEACRQHSGILLDHISSESTVHDHELARRLMGVDTYSWFGVSYGTYLGTLMAVLYPDRVERGVFDSAVNPDPDDEVIQAEGFDRSFVAFADWCAGQPTCTLGATRDEVVDTVVAWLDQLDGAPIRAGDQRLLTQSLAVWGIMIFLYFDADSYHDLATVLQAAMSGTPDHLLRAADIMNGRDDTGQYETMTYAFPAIRCADESDEGVDAAWQWWAQDQVRAPIFARLSGPDLICPLWTARPSATPDVSGTSSPPILVVQNTGDSATPFHNAEVMVDKLSDATLLVRESAGHGAYGQGSACIDDAVVRFLVDGTRPISGTRCTNG